MLHISCVFTQLLVTDSDWMQLFSVATKYVDAVYRRVDAINCKSLQNV